MYNDQATYNSDAGIWYEVGVQHETDFSGDWHGNRERFETLEAAQHDADAAHEDFSSPIRTRITKHQYERWEVVQ